MSPRQYFNAESATEVSDSSAAWTDGVSLNFTGDANADYVIFWSFEAINTYSVSANPVLGRVWDGSTAHDSVRMNSKNTTDYTAYSGFFRYQPGASPSAVTFKLQIQCFVASAGPAKGKNFRLTALRLESGDLYAEDLTQRASLTATTDTALNAAVTLSAGVGYVLLGSVIVTSSTTGWRRYSTLLDPSVSPLMSWGWTCNSTTDLWPILMAQDVASATAGSYAVGYMLPAGGSGNLTVQASKILALKKSNFDNVYLNTLASDDTGTQTTYTDTALAQTFTPAANPHLTIGAWCSEISSTSQSVSTHLLDNGSATSVSIRSPATGTSGNGGIAQGVADVSTFAASSRTQKMQRKSSNSGSTARLKANSTIVAFDLGSAPTATPRSFAAIAA